MTTQQENKPTHKAVGFRAPPDLAAWLAEQARENSRTVSNQTVWALQQYRKHQESDNAKKQA